MEDTKEIHLLSQTNALWDITKSIVKDIIEDTLYFIIESGLEEDDFNEAILLNALPANLRENSSNINIENNDDEEPKDGNSNQKNISLGFLNKCAIKLSKDKRLNIGEKLKIIELNKNDRVIYLLTNTYNIIKNTYR